MTHNPYIYIFIMGFVTFLIRVIPLTLIRGQLHSQFLKAFLYYVPYVTLAVMTFPAIIKATQTPLSGTIALIIGSLLAWYGGTLFQVSAICCAVVFIAEIFFI